MKSILCVLTVLVLSGCATGEKRFVAKMEAWQGRHSDELILKYGKPQETTKLSTGDTVYGYRFEFGQRTSVAVLGNVGQANASNEWCQINFVIDSVSNRIKSYTSNGNTCAAKRNNSVF